MGVSCSWPLWDQWCSLISRSADCVTIWCRRAVLFTEVATMGCPPRGFARPQPESSVPRTMCFYGHLGLGDDTKTGKESLQIADVRFNWCWIDPIPTWTPSKIVQNQLNAISISHWAGKNWRVFGLLRDDAWVTSPRGAMHRGACHLCHVTSRNRRTTSPRPPLNYGYS
jgi:hypothetical protein